MAKGSFEDLIAWKKARVFVRVMYGQFAASKDFAFRDQMLRAVLSIWHTMFDTFLVSSFRSSVRKRKRYRVSLRVS